MHDRKARTRTRMQWDRGLEAAWALMKDYNVRSVRGTHGPLLATPEKRAELKSALQVLSSSSCVAAGCDAQQSPHSDQ